MSIFNATDVLYFATVTEANNTTMLAGPGPAISNAHPFLFGSATVAEPGTTLLLATAIIASVLRAKMVSFRRRRAA